MVISDGSPERHHMEKVNGDGYVVPRQGSEPSDHTPESIDPPDTVQRNKQLDNVILNEEDMYRTGEAKKPFLGNGRASTRKEIRKSL